jgi:hypothetical protein
MDDLIKVILPFFSTTKNYGQALRRLASFAFYEIYLLTLIMRSIPRVDSFFAGIEAWGPFGKVLGLIPNYTDYNISGIAIGFAVAIFTHMFQFHERISDVMGIRRQFDHKHILVPMAIQVGTAITPAKDKKLRQQRDKLMHAVFYKYASSRNKDSIVDQHDIEHALNAWSWLWVFVEGAVYWIITAIVALLMDDKHLAIILASGSFLAVVIATFQRLRLPGYARPQIETILNNQGANAEVRETFDAL